MSEHPGFEPLEAPDLDNLYDEERESVVERVDRYADLVFDDDEPEVPLEPVSYTHLTLPTKRIV